MRVLLHRTSGRLVWRDTNDGYAQVSVSLLYDGDAPKRGEFCVELPASEPSDDELIAAVTRYYPRAVIETVETP